MATVTLLKPKDTTTAQRMRRYRQRKKAKRDRPNPAPSVTLDRNVAVTISTPEMCSLAARLTDGRATPGDLVVAEQLIMELVARLPRDGSIALTWPASAPPASICPTPST